MRADPITLLRAANPVPRTELTRLSAQLESDGGAVSIWARMHPPEALPAPPRRRRGIRLLLAAVILLVGALLVAPTFGLPLPALNFFQAEKAPPRIVHSFESFGVGAPPGMDPNVIAGQAREVTTVHAGDGAHTLWVAPTKQGGLCLEWTDGGGGCDTLGQFPLEVTWSSAGPFQLTHGQRPRPHRRPSAEELTSASGFIHSRYADSVEIRFEDGDVVRPRLVWVSAPIDAGFFFYDIPQEHRKSGHAIASVVALDDKGELVTQQGAARDLRDVNGLPADALVAEKTAAGRIETRQGPATVWEAPTRYEGHCWWFELEGRALPVAPCLPHGYAVAPLAVRLLATENDVLLLGVSSGFKTMEIRYADGDRDRVPVDNGVVLFEIPSQHLIPGHQATELAGLDDSGHVGVHFPAEVGLSSCFGALPLTRPASGPECLGG